ncbi:MAG: RdgB/HAM1 family non-canonical purine NTP pyrophosphatase [Flavobacteriales bacterium TMED191]|nr:MAG: RdgB/HAM1 family non-canonical purine NTP pyrophosphatase [Flavobacteriales bacterium TMED191]|tara:strand:+ start:2472 stop:3047 length:576 start_codon:yes stop_codon:yes gene_type:complete
MNKYILATSNNNKILEISSQLNTVNLLSLSDIGYFDEIDETGLSLEQNALIKSKTIYNKYNIDTISDDTGLEVDCLFGEPGVFSARYAGVHGDSKLNIEKLLKKMNKFSNRKAKFRTVICLKTKLKELFFEGICHGTISNKPLGLNGFGYDAVFIPNGQSKTFAQMNLVEKNKISHRFKAVQLLVNYIKSR